MFSQRYGTATDTPARQLADAVISNIKAARTNDGSSDTAGYTPDGVAGAWHPTDGCTAVTPNWGKVRPFAMTSSSQFRQPPPATDYTSILSSSTYADNLADVRSLGRYDSTTRTAEQTQIAWFWANDVDGTYKPPGQLLTATEFSAQLNTVGVATPRLYALASLAMADAGIAAWDMKFQTSVDLWRPETAIQEGSINPDPAWEPLSADPANNNSFSPCFPAYVSGHATFAAAWAGVMRNLFGDSTYLVLGTDDPHAVGVTRTYMSYTAAATENARSRVYLGVHYQFDGDEGGKAGYGIADYVVNNYLSPNSGAAG
ncbi:vanadium-dependent haloperoxidase [Micromonospora sp. MS34]|uniref:vanadium-dependent haloperoxidase n=1 Tax=Micromonospora sp. MS34 TaxID=3385971 RepID=UPI0039A35FF0